MNRSECTDASPRRLYRNPKRGWFAGVCAGLADYFGVSTGVVRLLTFVSALMFTFPTVVSYVAAAFILQRRPERLYADRREEAFWRSDLLDYKPYETWEEEGARDTQTLAAERVQKQLNTYQQPALDPAITEALNEFVAQKKAAEPDSFI